MAKKSDWTCSREALISGIEKAVAGLAELHDSLEEGICLPEDPCPYCTLQWEVLRAVSSKSADAEKAEQISPNAG